jgi:hypothetical protein
MAPPPASIEKVVTRPAIHHRTRITRAPALDPTPIVTGQEPPARSKAAENSHPATISAARIPEPPPATTESREGPPAKPPSAPAVAAAESVAAESAAADNPPATGAPADTTQGKDNKKTHNRVWRALGKILAPFH